MVGGPPCHTDGGGTLPVTVPGEGKPPSVTLPLKGWKVPPASVPWKGRRPLTSTVLDQGAHRTTTPGEGKGSFTC